MDNEDRKYLKYTEKIAPNLRIFGILTNMLIAEKKEIDRLVRVLDNLMLKTFKTI